MHNVSAWELGFLNFKHSKDGNKHRRPEMLRTIQPNVRLFEMIYSTPDMIDKIKENNDYWRVKPHLMPMNLNDKKAYGTNTGSMYVLLD